MTGLAFVQDLAVVMAVCAVTTLFCHWARLPAVLGYILAGIVIGPHTPPFSLVGEAKSVETLANLGVIFLMFSIGLEFNLRKLRRLGLTAFIATTLEVLLMIWIGYSVGGMLGWGLMDRLFLGAILSISSTTIIATVLIELDLMKKRFAQIIIAILIMEDLLAILIIAVLSALAISGTVSFESVSYSMLKVAAFMLLTIFPGVLIVPRLINFVSKMGLGPILIVVLLGLCFGFSVLGARLGFSLALGAFLIGAVVAESEEIEEIIRKIEPLRDMFIALFFVSVGMLLEFKEILAYGFPILVVAVAFILGKYSCVSFAVFLTGHDARVAMMTALCLTQIGEFSFIIAQLGSSAGVTQHDLFPIAVSVSVISSFFTPIFIRKRESLADMLARWVPKPLATFGEFYTSWIKRLRTAPRGKARPSFFARARTDLLASLAYLVLVAGVFAIGLHQSTRFARDWNPSVYWFLVGALIFPFWIGLIYSFDKLLWYFFFGRSRFYHEAEVSQAGKLIRYMFRAAILLAVCFLALAVGLPLLPDVPVLLAIGTVFTLMSFGFWALIRRFHTHLENTVRLVFEKEEPGAKKIEQERARRDLEELIKKEYPWEVQTEDILVPYKQTSVNQSIRDLKLPQITGAMIMAIYRGEGALVNPPPGTVIMPGDVLVVMGEKEQIQNAMRYLSEMMTKPVSAKAQDKPQALRVMIEASSPAAGRTLTAINLRAKTGTSVIGLQRGDGKSITNPPPATQLEDGDTVILFGTEEEIRKARKILLG